MATIVAAAGGGNWSATGTWTGSVVPTAADDVQLQSTSGNVTIDSAAACRSLDCTGYTGTLTHNAAVTLTIGDATAGAGNIALKLVAGMTYTLGSTTTSAITFVSTSATQQTVDYGGKNAASQTFNGAGGSWQLVSALTTAQTAAAQIILTAGSLDTNSQAITSGQMSFSGSTTRSLTLGASTINLSSNSGGVGVWNAATTTNLTFNAGTSNITINAVNQTFSGGGLTYYDMTWNPNSGGSFTVTGTNTFNNLTISPTASTRVGLSNDQTVNATLTLNSASTTNMGLLFSSVRGTARTITAAAASVSNIFIQDITAAGTSAPWSSTNTGDVGGNSNINFPAGVTRYWVGTSGGFWNNTSNWSTASGGASGASIPLPQDTAIFDANSITSTGKTITLNVQCLPALDFTGVTNSPTITFTITNGQIFVAGGFAFAAGLTISGTTITHAAGRSAYTITSNGVTLTFNLQISCPGGTYTLQDALVMTNQLTFNNGTFNANNNNVTMTAAIATSTTDTHAITMGSGTWTLTGTGTIADIRASGAFTLNAGTSTIVISDTSATTKTFSVGALAFYNLSITGGGTGSVTVSGTGNRTFNNVTINAPKTVLFGTGSGNATTVQGQFVATGSSGNLITLNSTSSGTQFFLTKASGIVSCDWLSVKDSNAGGGASWYAGANSTSVSNNTGWIFSAAPVPAGGMLLMGIG